MDSKTDQDIIEDLTYHIFKEDKICQTHAGIDLVERCIELVNEYAKDKYPMLSVTTTLQRDVEGRYYIDTGISKTYRMEL